MCGFYADEAVTFLAGDFSLHRQARDMPVENCMAFTIPLIADASVKLDGSLDEPVWRRARKLSSMKLIKTGKSPTEATESLVFATADTLYVGARLFTKDTSKLLSRQTGRDVGVYQDDCFEIFIDHNLDAKTYQHFTLNAIGAIDDYRFFYDPVAECFTYDKSWNPEWKHKSMLSGKEWTIEVAIPLQAAGIDPDKPFGMQIGRENHGLKEYSALTNTYRFPQASNFAIAMLGDLPPSLSGIKLKMNRPGDMILQAKAGQPGEVELHLAIANPYGKIQNETIETKTNAIGEFSAAFKLVAPSEGVYRITLSSSIGEKRLAPIGFSFALSLPPEIAFGDIFLNPRPKEMTLRKNARFTFAKSTPIILPVNASARTRTTARYLRNELFALTGLLLPITRKTTTADTAFYLFLRQDHKTTDQETGAKIDKLPAEGYYLDVTKNAVSMVGADERGLYYAAVTFMQLFRANLLSKHEPALGCARIFDWPDLANRIIVHWPHGRWRPREPKYPLPLLKHWLKTCVAGSKYNFWSVDFGGMLEFDRESKVTRPKYGFYTRAEYRELVRFCKEHFIEFVPSFQSGGHCFRLVQAYPELQEPGYDHDQVNVLHPKFYSILFSIYDDILDMAPGARYFHIWHDEWWHRPKADVRDTLMGKPRWQVYHDDLMKNYEYFKKRGIKLMMWGDFLSRRHNGGYPFFVHKARQGLPRDILIHNWSARSFPGSTRDFVKDGFEVWDVFNQFGPPPAEDVPLIKGFGTIAYGAFLQTFSHARDDIPPGYAHAILRAADYAWNMNHDPQFQLGEWRRRYLNSVNALYTFSDRQAASLRFKTVDLTPYATAKSSEWFGKPKFAPALERGRQDIGLIPMKIADSNDNDMVAATRDRREIFIPVTGRPKCLFLLQACFATKEEIAALKKQATRYVYGIPVGEVQIQYEDAPTGIIQLRLGVNTLFTNPHPTARFMSGTRYTHEIKTAGGKRASLYQIEWANPPARRNTRMRGIVWRRYDTPATPILFGLTLGQ